MILPSANWKRFFVSDWKTGIALGWSAKLLPTPSVRRSSPTTTRVTCLCSAIARSFGNFARQELENFLDTSTRSVFPGGLECAVINILAGAPVFHHSSAFQLREMTGDAGLAHAENLLEFCDRQLLLLEEQKQSQAGRIGQEPKQINR